MEIASAWVRRLIHRCRSWNSSTRAAGPQHGRWGKALSSGLLSLAGAGLMLLGFGALSVPVRGSLAPVRGPLVLYDRSGAPINSGFDTNHREKASVADFAPSLRAALLSSEDTRFWWHPGVDPIGITRALLVNIAGGQVLEGGSTLTQQLARSLYPNEVGEGDTLQRKWNELLVALQLEARFSKQALLLSYLNRVYLGVGWGLKMPRVPTSTNRPAR